jgi:hypothetical protein
LNRVASKMLWILGKEIWHLLMMKGSEF